MLIAGSAQRDKHVKSFSSSRSNVWAVTVGTTLPSSRIQENWRDFTAPLVCKTRGFWRQASRGQLSKHPKCVTNSSQELQPSPAELFLLPAVREGSACAVPAAQILWVTPNQRDGVSPGLWVGCGIQHGLFFQTKICTWSFFSHLLCPFSTNIPGL